MNYRNYAETGSRYTRANTGYAKSYAKNLPSDKLDLINKLEEIIYNKAFNKKIKKLNGVNLFELSWNELNKRKFINLKVEKVNYPSDWIRLVIYREDIESGHLINFFKDKDQMSFKRLENFLNNISSQNPKTPNSEKRPQHPKISIHQKTDNTYEKIFRESFNDGTFALFNLLPILNSFENKLIKDLGFSKKQIEATEKLPRHKEARFLSSLKDLFHLDKNTSLNELKKFLRSFMKLKVITDVPQVKDFLNYIGDNALETRLEALRKIFNYNTILKEIQNNS